MHRVDLSARRALCCAAVCLLALPRELPAQCLGNYAVDAGTTCFDDLPSLLDLLDDPSRRNTDFRMVQARNGQDTANARHSQYNNVCSLASAAIAFEHLGYSRFSPGAHTLGGFQYVTTTGLETYSGLDFGYRGSLEDLMRAYIHHNTLNHGVQHQWVNGQLVLTTDVGIYMNLFLNNAGTGLRTNLVACTPGGNYQYFDAGEYYGVCPSSGGQFEEWMNEVSAGCGSADCPCSVDAECGYTWALNSIFAGAQELGGCNDMRNRGVSTATQKSNARHILRAFVDNDVPLVVAVQNGGHFMVAVGYSELDSQGRPRYAILVDPVRQVYWLSDMTQTLGADRWSLSGIFPWNQHLAGGCQPGGWAERLDSLLLAGTSSDVCTMPAGFAPHCVERQYGIEVLCLQGGAWIQREYEGYLEDPFFTEQGNVSCDSVRVELTDLELAVSSARARRYGYSTATHRWTLLASGLAGAPAVDPVGWDMDGFRSVAVVDGGWADGAFLSARGLGGTYSAYRTTLELTMNDGSRINVEITPPETYGVAIECVRGSTVETYRAEARRGTFRIDDAVSPDRLVFPEAANKTCDTVRLRANFGLGEVPFAATIERQYFGADHLWKKANATAPWAPDTTDAVSDGLTGVTAQFTWAAAWPDGFYLAAENVGSGSDYGDRKTLIRLFDFAGQVMRQIEVVPN